MRLYLIRRKGAPLGSPATRPTGVSNSNPTSRTAPFHQEPKTLKRWPKGAQTGYETIARKFPLATSPYFRGLQAVHIKEPLMNNSNSCPRQKPSLLASVQNVDPGRPPHFRPGSSTAIFLQVPANRLPSPSLAIWPFASPKPTPISPPPPAQTPAPRLHSKTPIALPCRLGDNEGSSTPQPTPVPDLKVS